MPILTKMAKSERIAILMLHAIQQLSHSPVTAEKLQAAKDTISKIEDLLISEE